MSLNLYENLDQYIINRRDEEYKRIRKNTFIVKKLIQLCKERKINRYSGLKKAELIKLLSV